MFIWLFGFYLFFILSVFISSQMFCNKVTCLRSSFLTLFVIVTWLHTGKVYFHSNSKIHCFQLSDWLSVNFSPLKTVSASISETRISQALMIWSGNSTQACLNISLVRLGAVKCSLRRIGNLVQHKCFFSNLFYGATWTPFGAARWSNTTEGVFKVTLVRYNFGVISEVNLQTSAAGGVTVRTKEPGSKCRIVK